jgi:hypothetical protein
MLALGCSREVVRPKNVVRGCAHRAMLHVLVYVSLYDNGDDEASRKEFVDIEHQAHLEDVQSAHRT